MAICLQWSYRPAGSGFGADKQNGSYRCFGFCGAYHSAVSVVRKRLRLRMESDAFLKQLFENMADKLSRLKI